MPGASCIARWLRSFRLLDGNGQHHIYRLIGRSRYVYDLAILSACWDEYSHLLAIEKRHQAANTRIGLLSTDRQRGVMFERAASAGTLNKGQFT